MFDNKDYIYEDEPDESKEISLTEYYSQDILPDFNNIHFTQDGSKMYLEEMTDSHLFNTINLMLTRLQVAKDTLNTKERSKFIQIYQNKKLNTTSAVKHVKAFKMSMPKYIFEATLRGLDVSLQITKIKNLLERDTEKKLGYERGLE